MATTLKRTDAIIAPGAHSAENIERRSPAVQNRDFSTVPDPVLRDSLEDAPAWGGGIHTWCQCGCTGDEDHFRNVNWRVDFPFVDE